MKLLSNKFVGGSEAEAMTAPVFGAENVEI
jgi:hypothetical protein